MRYLKPYKLFESKKKKTSAGIIFLREDGKDVGCCIGVRHGKDIKLSEDLIERISNVKNLHFVAEGIASKEPDKEPGMVKFLEKHFPDDKLRKKSWDDITEDNDKGTANPKLNIVYTFMQHRYNKYINWYTYTEGTMLEAMAKPDFGDHKRFPKNSPISFSKRLEWLTAHMKKAGFYDKLNKPFDKNKLLKIMDEMEYSVYPDQVFPDTESYFGKMQQQIEDERNLTIYELMKDGACCFAGSGHLVELKKQFPDLQIIEPDGVELKFSK